MKILLHKNTQFLKNCSVMNLQWQYQKHWQAHRNILSSEAFKVNSSCEIWGFMQYCVWDLGFSETWHCVLRHGTVSLVECYPPFWRSVVPSPSCAMGHSSWHSWPLRMKELHFFKMSENTHPLTLHRIPETHECSFSTFSMHFFYTQSLNFLNGSNAKQY